MNQVANYIVGFIPITISRTLLSVLFWTKKSVNKILNALYS